MLGLGGGIAAGARSRRGTGRAGPIDRVAAADGRVRGRSKVREHLVVDPFLDSDCGWLAVLTEAVGTAVVDAVHYYQEAFLSLLPDTQTPLH